MGAGAVTMLTPGGISIDLRRTNILACLEMNVVTSYYLLGEGGVKWG
jgi:hypothetical protein